MCCDQRQWRCLDEGDLAGILGRTRLEACSLIGGLLTAVDELVARRMILSEARAILHYNLVWVPRHLEAPISLK